jgi:hypothetical protein
MKYYTLLILLMAGTSSCYHIYYAPNTANTPLFTEKGQTRINGIYCGGGDSEFNGGELQLAHSAGKNFGLMANFMAAGKKENLSENNGSTEVEKGNGSYLELGAGYFKSFDKQKKWVGEIYGGAGSGTVKNEYGYNDLSKVNIFKLFFQPAVGYKTTYFEIAFAPKISHVNWRVKESIFTSQQNESDKSNIEAIRNKKSFLAFEPALIIRAGGKDFKVHAGLSFSDFKPSSIREDGLTETLNGSIGISLNLNHTKN